MKKNVIRGIIAVLVIAAIFAAVYFVRVKPQLAPDDIDDKKKAMHCAGGLSCTNG